MRNAGLDEAQAGIQIARRNINNFRYADDTTLMAESEEEINNVYEGKEENEFKDLDCGFRSCTGLEGALCLPSKISGSQNGL